MPHTYRVQVQALDREVPPLQFDCQNHDDIFAIPRISDQKKLAVGARATECIG